MAHTGTTGATTHIGTGLVSVGWMGRLHARAYMAAPQHYPELNIRPELVIAADTAEASRTYARAVLGYRDATSDYHAVIDHPDVQAVSICAPNYLHHEIALAAIAAGKPFWIEKPMGRGVAESREIAQAAAAAGVQTAVGFNYRHAPAIAYARKLINDGRLGEVTNVKVSFLADYSADPDGALTWRFDPTLAGSGVTGDLLSHGIDLAQYLVGVLTSVVSLSETFIPSRPLPSDPSAGHFSAGDANAAHGTVGNEDYAALLGRFSTGAVGVFEASRVSVGPRAEYRIDVYGTAGSLRWNFERMNELQVADGTSGYRTMMAGPDFGDFAHFQPGAGTSMGFDDLKTIEAALFLRSVRDNEQFAPSAADAWSAASVADAAARSAENHAWVDVEPVTENTTFDVR